MNGFPWYVIGLAAGFYICWTMVKAGWIVVT